MAIGVLNILCPFLAVTARSMVAVILILSIYSFRFPNQWLLGRNENILKIKWRSLKVQRVNY